MKSTRACVPTKLRIIPFKKPPASNLLKPLPNEKTLNSSKMKEFADDNFKFDVNGKKVSKRVENTMGKGEIARYEQFLLFPKCFIQISSADT